MREIEIERSKKYIVALQISPTLLTQFVYRFSLSLSLLLPRFAPLDGELFPRFAVSSLQRRYRSALETVQFGKRRLRYNRTDF